MTHKDQKLGLRLKSYWNVVFVVVPPRSPDETYIAQVNLTLDLSHLCAKFSRDRIEIASYELFVFYRSGNTFTQI